MAVSRRAFFGLSAGTGAAAIGLLGASRAGARQPDGGEPAPWSPITDHALALAVVGASHNNLDRVRELVSVHPELAKSAVDWGFGDWETAIGAASHVGRPDIVEYLIANGARPDLFTFTMLGNLPAVRAMIEASPGIQRIPGPHGITLMQHARAGREAAAAVVEYLGTLDGADDVPTNQPIESPATFLGEYDLISERGSFTIAEGRRGIELRIPDQTMRNLIHLGNLEFHPAGAPSVRFQFTPGASDAAPTLAAINLGDRIVKAARRIG